jgi:hypothetical protein
MEFLERQALIAALEQSFNRPTFTTMLLTLDKKLDNLVSPGTYVQNVETVVLTAEQEGWVWSLVDKAHEAVPLSLSLNAFIAAYPEYDPTKVAASIADHLMAHLLRGGRCFIDRTDLRGKLGQLRSADSRVLIVTGDRRTGKTYTRELINFLCDKTANYRAIIADLDRSPFDALGLAEHLGAQLGLDRETIPKQDQEQKTRWTLRLCDWLTSPIVGSPNTIYWFVFDGFREQPLLPDARDLLSELALRAELNFKQVRIVLLNYREDLPIDITDYVLREEVKMIGRDELFEFFNQINNDYGKKLTDTDLSMKVDVIIKSVDDAMAGNQTGNGGDERMHKLNLAVSETVKLLFA